jgi:hypothetical protein
MKTGIPGAPGKADPGMTKEGFVAQQILLCRAA